MKERKKERKKERRKYVCKEEITNE